MNAEAGLAGLEALGDFGEALSPLLDFLDPTADARACAAGEKGACMWAAIGVFPWGKFGRLGRMLDDLPGGGGGKVAGNSVNMPSWKNIDIDIDHIVDNHTVGGKGYKQSGVKDKFPDHMSEGSIESTVRQAYRNAQKVGPSQGDRYKMRGHANGMTIEMWVNVKTKEIETAYPVGR
jgi:hypothetical protein